MFLITLYHPQSQGGIIARGVTEDEDGMSDICRLAEARGIPVTVEPIEGELADLESAIIEFGPEI